MLRRTILATAAVVAMAPAAMAQDGMSDSLVASGDVTVAGQYSSWTGDGYWTPESGVGIDAYGRVMVPFGDGFSFQVDGSLESTPSSATFARSTFLGGHLSWRDPDRFLIGVIGGIGMGVVDMDDPGPDMEPYNAYLLGVEGQLYRNDTTFFKQVGIARAYEEGDPDNEPLDLVFVRGGVRHFTGDMVLDAELGLATGTFEGGDSGLTDVSIVTWGVGVEKQLNTTQQLSIFARYEGSLHSLAYCSASMTEHRILVGLRAAFGGQNAKDRDHNGVTGDLPRFPMYPAVDGLEYCGGGG